MEPGKRGGIWVRRGPCGDATANQTLQQDIIRYLYFEGHGLPFEELLQAVEIIEH